MNGLQTLELYSSAVSTTYKHSPHDPILPWKSIDTLLLRQRVHDVEQYNESWYLHGKPSNLAWDVEAEVVGRLPCWIPIEEPLKGCNLLTCENRDLGKGRDANHNGKELKYGADKLPMLPRRRTPTFEDDHPWSDPKPRNRIPSASEG